MMEVGGSGEGKKRVMTNQEVKTSKQQQALLRFLRVVLSVLYLLYSAFLCTAC